MKKVPLTIVVPIRNRAHLVVRTLDSIAASTCAFEELLIVDNGSEDETVAVCSEWIETHPEVTARLLSEPRAGAAVARNRGLRACRTDYVYFFDSDDVFSENFIACIAAEMAQPFDVLCVPVRQEVNRAVQIRPYRACGDVYVHLINNMLSTQTMVFNKRFLESIGGWNEALTTWDDWELGVRVLLAHPKLRWHKREAFHRVIVHSESLTGESFTATLPAIVQAMQAVSEAIERAKLTGREQRRAAKAYALRCMIYGGLLRHEGSHDGEAAFTALAGASPHWMGKLQLWYTAHGGRGAWRLAMAIVDITC